MDLEKGKKKKGWLQNERSVSKIKQEEENDYVNRIDFILKADSNLKQIHLNPCPPPLFSMDSGMCTED